MKLLKRIPAHYEVQEVGELGRGYKWCPEKAVVECSACGKRMTFKRTSLLTSIVTCECGAQNTAEIREELVREQLANDALIHPWRYWRSEEGSGIPV